MRHMGKSFGRARAARPGSSTSRRWAALVALPAVMTAFFVVSGAEAKPKASADPTDDPRCAAPPIAVDAKSETTINPLGGTRIVLTRADCKEASESETAPTQSSTSNQVVVAVESGQQRFVAFVGRFVDDQESQGSTSTTGASKRIQQMELHLPIAGDRICVEFNDDEVCFPPR